MSPTTILCVDDHEPALALLKFLLEAKGYEVILTTSPAKALIVATTGRDIQLVITDFTMPVMSGGELIQEIRRWRPEMPIILFTGASNIHGVRGIGESGWPVRSRLRFVKMRVKHDVCSTPYSPTHSFWIPPSLMADHDTECQGTRLKNAALRAWFVSAFFGGVELHFVLKARN